MQKWMQVLAAPPKGYPETIDVPTYFLQTLNTPGWFVFFSVLFLAVLVIVVAGCFYYEKHPAKPRKKGKEKKADDLAKEKGETK